MEFSSCMLVREYPLKVWVIVMKLSKGNYPVLDLQQQSTGMIDKSYIAQRVSATVVSYYPDRGEGGRDEALIDAGAIAFSKDTGPSGGYGEVLGKNWHLGRISQEHGILTRTGDETEKLQVGTIVEIVGQHACLITAVSRTIDMHGTILKDVVWYPRPIHGIT